MVGIDVGVTKVTYSNGEVAELRRDVPGDLLIRVADDTPYVTVKNGECTARPAHDIYAEAVADALSGRPAEDESEFRAALAIPAWWTPRTISRVREALLRLDVNVELVKDAEAAIVDHEQSGHPLPEHVIVASLRSNQVSTVIVRNCRTIPVALSTPIHVHQEGGADLDLAVLQHIVDGINDLDGGLDTTAPEIIAAAKASLSDCKDLREALSTTATESFNPKFPEAIHRIRMVRSELEDVATPWADAVVRIVSSTLEQSSLPVSTVLLTGGLSQMPLISQRISADLGLDVLVSEDPTLSTVRGAETIMQIRLTAQQEETTPISTTTGFPLWGMLKKRITNRRPRLQDSEAPSEAQGSVVEEPVETLLDPVTDQGAYSPDVDNPVNETDTSWIPLSPKSTNLVNQR